MIIIKATLRDETRRLMFDSNGFPEYDDVQQRLRAIFNLPSTAHPFWSNVLFFPDDTKPSRIKFKHHVCTAEEYKQAQQPFSRITGYPSPLLVFTVLLSSDSRMNKIRDFHRSAKLQADLAQLETDIRALEDDLVERHQLLVALEDKVEDCQLQNDDVGVGYWSDRAEEKRRSLPQLDEQLRGWRISRRNILDDLDAVRPTGLSLRQWADLEKTAENRRTEETNQELCAWQIENNDDPSSPFPPLDSVLHGAANNGRGPRPGHHPYAWDGFANLGAPPPPPPGMRPPPHVPAAIRSLFNPPENAGREIGQLLDRFLVHFQGQLVETLDDFAARIAPASAAAPSQSQDDAAPHVPGAFVTTPPTQAHAAQPSEAEEPKCKKHAKGGFRHKHITCDGCLTGIRGMRYHCLVCPDYDLCGTCLPLLHTEELHPPSHTFKAMLHRGLEERITFGGTEPTRPSQQSCRHPATCDVCDQNIIGVRWKCLECVDWDCCSSCAKSVGTTHPGHSFVKLHKATDYVSNPLSDAKANVTHPYVICDGCNDTIRGARYKCMHPSCAGTLAGYDLCEKCEAKPVPVHPEDHPMLKIKTPLRVNVQSSFDPIDKVYDDHHRRFRVPKTAPKAASPPKTKTTCNAPSAQACSSSRTVQPSAFSRGGEYAKAMDALIETMSLAGTEIRVPGGYVISKGAEQASNIASSSKAVSVKTEEEEMASLATPMAPTVASPKLIAEPAAPVIERTVTPVPVGSFPVTPVKTAPSATPIPSAPIPSWKTPEPVTFKSSGPTGRPFAQPTPPKVVDEAWECKTCTLMNPASAVDKCVVCEATKPEKRIVIEEVTKDVEVEQETVKETVTEDPITKIIAAAAPPLTKEPIGPNDIFTYVRHATIPPGTRLPAGAEFTKTWTVRHYANGSDFEFDNLKLVHKTDGALGRHCKPHVAVRREDVVNGEDVEVKVEGLIVPDQPGEEVMEMWRFEDDKGVAYGQPLRVRIHVEETNSGEASLASSSSSFVLPQAPVASQTPDEFVEVEAVSAAEFNDRLSEVAPPTPDADDVSSVFSFSDVENDVTVTAAPQTVSSTESEVSDEYDFVDESFDGETTEDGF